jgi:DNA polymerase-1
MGQDIHAASVAAVMGVPLDKVTKDMRRLGKSINFGLVYGMSPFGLSRYAGITLAEAENFVKAYFQRFPAVKRFMDHLRRQASQVGYVETLLGRRRYFPNLRNPSSNNINVRNREEREAINAPIQGSAADIMKIAMIRLPAALAACGCPARLLLQVHDELVLETPRDALDQSRRVVQEVMEGALELSVPLETEARCGIDWGTMEVMAGSR